MPTFEETRTQYMAAGGGSSLSGAGGLSLPIHTGCEVEALIQDRAVLSASAYFDLIKTRINALGTGSSDGSFIYIAGWWLGRDFSLDYPAATRLTNLLIQKSRAGVDVRVMGWVMAPETLRNRQVQGLATSLIRLNSDTMNFINDLRAEPTLANKAVLNILSHPAASVHTKMVIIGDNSQASGFTGGLDFQNARHDPVWHDVHAQVKGPVVQSLFDMFRQMWNEIQGRPVAAGLTASGVTCDSHTSSMPTLASRALTSPSSGRVHMQSARTYPRFNFSTGTGIVGLPRNTSLSFASNGLFEIKQMWEKGIKGGRTYIYMEDQAFTSTEIFDWINTTLRAHSELKVILVAGGDDPTAPSPGELTKANIKAVNDHLLKNLSTADITNRVAYCKYKTSKYVHTKSTIVDDLWAMIGSANCMRRSLYSDIEHAVGFMDEAGAVVSGYRTTLWRTVLGASHATAAAGVAAFFSLPFHGAGGTSTALVERLNLPFPNNPLTADEQTLVDEIYDVDSRQAWGGGLISLYLRRIGSGSMSP